MVPVVLDGWNPGLSGLSLLVLVRTHTGCRLAEAKHGLDALLEGTPWRLEFPSIDAARAFEEAVVAIGAIARIGEVEPIVSTDDLRLVLGGDAPAPSRLVLVSGARTVEVQRVLGESGLPRHRVRAA